MRELSWMVCLLLLSACAATPDENRCTEPRPQVCTMQYAPTCGVLQNGERKTYSSPCNACADDQVVAREPGACPE